MILYTIGVYGSDKRTFFNKLINEKIDLFCDIRQRRGVRGAKYSFVNSKNLQNELMLLNIEYRYIQELSPTIEMRNLQKEQDKKLKILKSERSCLVDTFVDEYANNILNSFNFNSLINSCKVKALQRIAFFCVEECVDACHRSLVVDKLNKDYNFEIKHI